MNPATIKSVTIDLLTAGAAIAYIRQCRKPAWLPGRLVVAGMNVRHSGLTAWGLGHLSIRADAIVLDVGCGGGRTIETLAGLAPDGKVFGVDYAAASVAASKRHNASLIGAGRVDVRQASVSSLPFPPSTFDVITAVETHYYWPNLPQDVKEVLRVLKPGGAFMLLAETYKGRSFDWLYRPVMTGLLSASYLSVDEHRALLVDAGCVGVEVSVDEGKGWICAVGHKRGAT